MCAKMLMALERGVNLLQQEPRILRDYSDAYFSRSIFIVLEYSGVTSLAK